MTPVLPNSGEAESGLLRVTGDLRGRMTGLMCALDPSKPSTREEFDAVLVLSKAIFRQNTEPVLLMDGPGSAATSTVCRSTATARSS